MNKHICDAEINLNYQSFEHDDINVYNDQTVRGNMNISSDESTHSNDICDEEYDYGRSDIDEFVKQMSEEGFNLLINLRKKCELPYSKSLEILRQFSFLLK